MPVEVESSPRYERPAPQERYDSPESYVAPQISEPARAERPFETPAMDRFEALRQGKPAAAPIEFDATDVDSFIDDLVDEVDSEDRF